VRRKLIGIGTVAALLSCVAWQTQAGEYARFPFTPRTKEEAVAVTHLKHALDLLAAARREIEAARSLRDWEERDWARMSVHILQMEKDIEDFLYPLQMINIYPDEISERLIPESGPVAAPVVSAREDPYPNGEDMPFSVRERPQTGAIQTEKKGGVQ